MYWTLNEFSCPDVHDECGFFYLFLEMPGNRTGEMHLQFLIIVFHEIPDKEIRKASCQQFIDVMVCSVFRKERGKTGQKSVGLGLAIYFFYDFCGGESCLFEECVSDVFRCLHFQTITCNMLA